MVPTIIQGGFRSNVIPSEAEATIDVRALPDEDMPKFYAWLKQLINDPAVERGAAEASASPRRHPRASTTKCSTRSRRRAQMFPAPTLPAMLTGATDNAQLRSKGVQAYGFGPIVTPDEGPLGGAHGDDERISARSLMALIEYLWNTLMELG